MLKIQSFFEQSMGGFSYLLADTVSGEAAVIDPVLEFDVASGKARVGLAEAIIASAAERGWHIRWLLETRAQVAHLSASRYLREEVCAGIGIGERITETQAQAQRLLQMPTDFAADGRQFDRLLRDGDEIHLGETRIQVLATPGVAQEAVCYRVEDQLFTGDLLRYPELEPGRSDLPGGDTGALFDSLRCVRELPDATRIHPGHLHPSNSGDFLPVTRIAGLRRLDPLLDDAIRRQQFIHYCDALDQPLSVPPLLCAALYANIQMNPDPAQVAALVGETPDMTLLCAEAAQAAEQMAASGADGPQRW